MTAADSHHPDLPRPDPAPPRPATVDPGRRTLRRPIVIVGRRAAR